MEHLWAPWRLSYVAAPKRPDGDDPCFLCRGLAEQKDKDNLIVWRRAKTAVVLNRFPYNNGHLLIAPNAHKGDLGELTDEEMLEGQHTLNKMVEILRETMHPEGFNIGLNLGRVAGAGLPGHLHWHIVPRWHGDTNFMPVLGETKVIVQSLESLFEMLRARVPSK